MNPRNAPISPGKQSPLDRAFSLEAVRVTEAAAIAAAQQIGRGDEHAADHAAVEAMRIAFNSLPISGTVRIGEGERDEAPMLYIGEEVGMGGLAVDIALDPLEGTTLTAKAMANALAVMAMAEPGTLLTRPTPTWTSSPSVPAIRKASWTSMPIRPRTSWPWRRRRASSRRTSPPASWTGRGMRS